MLIKMLAVSTEGCFWVDLCPYSQPLLSLLTPVPPASILNSLHPVPITPTTCHTWKHLPFTPVQLSRKAPRLLFTWLTHSRSSQFNLHWLHGTSPGITPSRENYTLVTSLYLCSHRTLGTSASVLLKLLASCDCVSQHLTFPIPTHLH